MVTMTRRPNHRRGGTLARTVGALVACVVAVGIAGQLEAADAPDEAVTISELKEWALMGTDPNVMRSRIQESGTVYRMTPGASSKLREDGIPPSLISYMDLLYTNAVKHHPSLAGSGSDDHWTKVGNYEYGGRPFGWPEDWVVGAPKLGSGLKGEAGEAVHAVDDAAKDAAGAVKDAGKDVEKAVGD